MASLSRPIDAAFVAAALLAPMFNVQIGPLTPLILIALIPAFLWIRRDRVAVVFARCWPLLALPMLALASTLWSIDPAATTRFATLYLVTALVGILMGAGLDRVALMLGIFAAAAIYAFASALFGDFVGWGEGGSTTQAFGGLSGSKNMAGDTAAFALLAAIAATGMGIARRWPLLTLAGLVSVVPATWILWNAHATGALIAGALASVCLLLWLISYPFPTQLRGAVFVLILLVLIAGLSTQSIWLPDLFDYVLSSSGKDAGLTGRADLWRKADELIDQRPVLGLGFGAFWVHGNLDAEALWRMFGIGGRSGFNFHNTVREILVALGYVGLATAGITLAICWPANAIRAMVKPDITRIFFCAWSVYASMKLGFEVLGFTQMNHNTVLMFASLAMGLRVDRGSVAYVDTRATR